MNEACALSGSSPIANAPGYAGVPPADSFSLYPAIHASTSIAEGYAGVPPACSFLRALHPFLCRRDAGVPRDGVPRYDPRTIRRGVKSANQPREPSRVEEDTTVIFAENGGGTFPVLERSEEREHGEYRTRSGVMESYDALAAATGSGTPYHSPLEPPRRAA